MLGLTFINGTVEQIYLGSAEQSVMTTLLGTGTDIGARLSALWSVLWFDYAFFENEWTLVRYVFCSISASVLLVITLGVVSGIASFARRFFTGGV